MIYDHFNLKYQAPYCIYECTEEKNPFNRNKINHRWCNTKSSNSYELRLIRWVSLVEQELLTLRKHLSSHPVFSGVRVTRSLVLYVCFVDCCLSFCTFSFGHCFVCSSSIYGFRLPLWYLQTLLTSTTANTNFSYQYIPHLPTLLLFMIKRNIFNFC